MAIRGIKVERGLPIRIAEIQVGDFAEKNQPEVLLALNHFAKALIILGANRIEVDANANDSGAQLLMDEMIDALDELSENSERPDVHIVITGIKKEYRSKE